MPGDKKMFVVIPAYQAASTLGTVFARLPVQLQTKEIGRAHV